MTKVKGVGPTVGLGTTDEEAWANAIEIITAKFVDPEWVGGMLKVYDEIPWVSKDQESLELVLRDEVFGYWGPENNWAEPILCSGYQGDCYINPASVCSVKDKRLSDSEGCDYYYCDILMQSGQHFYFPNIWANAFREEVAE